ncbi:uncharacterized protein EDB91DRAFT_1091079 [Suillus paluster]|uniref:uncharacterized protein n=1 Tax=Suillus paluster TaxID=48578 RepID=UPI001B86B13C|nr:uncharacterized protein EDB91DRAFT_1091079 [Suillus paluster]KAG1717394.1 hypothetical protein EDB91DRAFT_1091079 [Suillus paluster]
MWGVAGRLRSEFLLGQPPFTVCMESPAGILWATGPAGLSTSVFPELSGCIQLVAGSLENTLWSAWRDIHSQTREREYVNEVNSPFMQDAGITVIPDPIAVNGHALDYQNSPFMQDLGITVIPDPGWMSLSESLVHIAKGGWPYKQEFTSRSASHPPHTAGVGRPTGPDAQSMSAGPDMQIADGGWPCKQEFSPRPASHPPTYCRGGQATGPDAQSMSAGPSMQAAKEGRPSKNSFPGQPATPHTLQRWAGLLGQKPKACRLTHLCRLQREAGPARIHS